MSSAKLLIGLLFVTVIGAVGYFNFAEKQEIVNGAPSAQFEPNERSEDPGEPEDTSSFPDREVVAENLSIPWDIVFLPDGSHVVTERPGTLLHFVNGDVHEIPIPEAVHVGEGGLLGAVLHPDFEENRYFYLYHTAESGDGLVNRVVRYEFSNGSLKNPQTILEGIPGARYHDGGRIAFGPDGYLYISTGDAQSSRNSQDTNSLAGKILRIRDDGSLPEDNPFGNAVYAYGLRNTQGLVWDDAGRLWSTDHGRSGARSGMDELNLITKGENYGWPDSEGNTVASGTVGPVIHSGADTTWAPASALYWDGSIFFGGLISNTLYEAVLSGEDVVELREHFRGEFGRIRTVELGPDGMFYMTTSNRDGRGVPEENDDRIIRVNPEQFRR